MSIRALSAELQQKAMDELNEVPKRRRDDIDCIKHWIEKQPHLIAKTDDQTILNFLRCCKFNIQKTKDKIDFYYTMKTTTPEFFSNKDPMLPEIQDILHRGIFVPFPKPMGSAEPMVLLYRWGRADSSKNSPKNLVKALSMTLDVLLKENDNFLIAGHQSLIDLNGLPYNYLTQVSPFFFKKIVMCAQNAYPLRLKEMNFINIPPFFETIINMIKPFINQKLKNRLIFYGNNYMDKLHSTFPLSILPKEYGGEEECVDELAAKWKVKVESYRDWFINDDKYYIDESKRPGKRSLEVFGLEGCFRKLEID